MKFSHQPYVLSTPPVIIRMCLSGLDVFFVPENIALGFFKTLLCMKKLILHYFSYNTYLKKIKSTKKKVNCILTILGSTIFYSRFFKKFIKKDLNGISFY